MDVIELIAESPLVFCIIDLETTIWRNAFYLGTWLGEGCWEVYLLEWLDGAEIGSENTSIWKLLCWSLSELDRYEKLLHPPNSVAQIPVPGTRVSK